MARVWQVDLAGRVVSIVSENPGRCGYDRVIAGLARARDRRDGRCLLTRTALISHSLTTQHLHRGAQFTEEALQKNLEFVVDQLNKLNDPEICELGPPLDDDRPLPEIGVILFLSDAAASLQRLVFFSKRS